MTIWRPDTCRCVIEYRSDLTLAAIAPCAAHFAIVAEFGEGAAYEAVQVENRCKNDAIGAMAALEPTLSVDEVSFLFDANRALKLSIPSRLATSRTVLAAAVDAKVGAGKVTIDTRQDLIGVIARK